MLEIEAKHTGRPPEIISVEDTRINTRTQAAKDAGMSVHQNIQAEDTLKFTRTQAAKDAGMTEHQRKRNVSMTLRHQVGLFSV